MRKKLTTTIDEKVLKEIKMQALREDLNISRFIEKMYQYYILTNHSEESMDNTNQ